MTQTLIDDATLKARHRAMWALGDYPAVATEVIAELGPTLVEAVAVRPASGCSTWPPGPATSRCRPPGPAPASPRPT